MPLRASRTPYTDDKSKQRRVWHKVLGNNETHFARGWITRLIYWAFQKMLNDTKFCVPFNISLRFSVKTNSTVQKLPWKMYTQLVKKFVLMMEAVTTSETSVNLYETTRRNIPEDSSSRNSMFLRNRKVMFCQQNPATEPYPEPV
jgi:hypothetical protein